MGFNRISALLLPLGIPGIPYGGTLSDISKVEPNMKLRYYMLPNLLALFLTTN